MLYKVLTILVFLSLLSGCQSIAIAPPIYVSDNSLSGSVKYTIESKIDKSPCGFQDIVHQYRLEFPEGIERYFSYQQCGTGCKTPQERKINIVDFEIKSVKTALKGCG